MSSVFTKIINRELPANIVFEDKNLIVITDHKPRDLIHLLIIWKEEYLNFMDTPSDVFQQMCETAKNIATMLGIADHFRLQINNGYGQEVDHIHIHMLSNRPSDTSKNYIQSKS